MDGAVSFFEQESFSFSRFLPGFLLPGPIRYVPRTDSFITVSSTWQVESYKYQVLAVATDVKSKAESQSITSGKRITVSKFKALDILSIQNLLGNDQWRAVDSIKHCEKRLSLKKQSFWESEILSVKFQKTFFFFQTYESAQICATRVFFFHYSLATSMTIWV